MRRIVLLTIVLCLYALPAAAVNYFVSTSGNDGADGLTVGTAWKTLDNGDAKGLLAPGDTVFIEPGTYMPDRSYVFTMSGTTADPIVYMKSSGGQAVVRALSGTNAALRIQGDNLEFHTLDISCDALATIGGIEIDGSSCLVTGCEIFGIYRDGVKVNGGDNTILRNIIHSCDDNGIESAMSAAGNRFYGNTVFGNGLSGLDLLGAGNENRAFNNIVVQNAQHGISGAADNVCGFNDAWNNTGGDYANGVADSSGGISEDPLFVDGPGRDFNLQTDSPAVNAGLDLGYQYFGPAPDMGALESDVAPPAGTLVWRSEASAMPQQSRWNGISFSAGTNTADVGVWRIIAGAEAPTRDEAVLIGVDIDGKVTFQVWDGTSWTASPLNPLSTLSESSWWSCDAAYMQQTGDAVVVWNNGSSGADGLSYLVGNQFGWTEEDTIAAPLAGEPKHMLLAASPISDEMVLIVSNEFSQDYAIVWDGAAWGNAEVVDNSGAGDDRTDIYVGYEQQSGEALAVWGWGLPAVYYSIWNGVEWSVAQGLAKPADAEGNVRWTTLAADPRSDRIALGVLTLDQDVWLCVWNGDTWEVPETGTNSMSGATYPGVAVAFEGLSGEAIATYGEGPQVRYRTWASGTGWSGGLHAATLLDIPNSMMLDAAPGSDQVMLSVQDGGNGLKCVRWDGASWGVLEEIEANTGEDENQPFVFLWDITGTGADLAIGKGVSNGSPAEGDTIVYTLSLRNYGPEDATGVEVSDLLPPGLTHVSDDPSQGTYTPGSGVWYIGDLASGYNATLSISTSVDIGTDGQTITNTATLAALDQDDPNAANDAASVNIGVKETHFRVATGHYTGNGLENQSVSDIGFSPDFVIVKGDIAEPSVAKSSTMPGGLSKELGTSNALVPDLVKSLDADGFTVGPAQQVNDVGTDYYWAAFQSAPGEMAVGSYVGDGADDRSIEDPGFRPAYVIVMGEDSEHAMQRFAGQDIDRSKEFGSSGEKSDRIQAFEGLGFQVGKHNTVNEQERMFHFVAWKAVSGHVVDSTYVGDGVSGRDITGFGLEPHYVIAASKESEDAVHRFGPMVGDNTFIFDAATTFAEGIQTFLSDGFRVGSHKRVNEDSKSIFCVVFRDNSPPELAGIGPQSVDEGANLNFIVSASDPDSTTPALAAENVPANASFLDNGDGTGTFDFDPDYTQAGLYSVRFIASDGALRDSMMVGITVNNTNRPPELAGIGPQSVDEGANLNLTVSASDPDGTTPALTAENVPANASFLDNGDGTGTFDFDPDYTQAGLYSVRFIASDGALRDSMMVGITVNNTNRPPELAGIGPQSVDEGANLNLTVSASDPDGTTPALAAENVPANASFLDNGDGTGTFDFDPDYTQAGLYSVRFIASDGALADSMVVGITVNNTNRPPELAGIGSQSVEEGANLNFTVPASDPDGTTPSLVAEDMPVNASFLDNGDGTGTFDFDPDYTQAGLYSVRFIASDGALADSELVALTVTPAPLAYIVIDPDSVVVSADSTLQFAAAGYDAGGQPEDAGSITWALIDSLGTIDSAGFFDPTTTGATRVTGASSLGPVDTTTYLEVLPGNLFTLEVSPDTATVSADSTLQFTVSGYDLDGNSVGGLGVITWQVLGGIGSIDATGFFIAQRAGTGFVKSTSSLGVWAKTDTITVTPGEISFIDALPYSQVVIEDSSYQFNAYAFDADTNLVADVTTNATWTTTDPSGSVTAAGLYTAGNNPSPPTYYVIASLHMPLASLHTLTDSSAVTVISSGSLNHVRVEYEDGTEFGDTTLTADNDTTVLYCRGYDSGNTLIGDFAAAWTAIGEDSVGWVEEGPAVLTRLNLTGPGSLRVVATYAAGVSDTTGTITCVPGEAASLAIVPDTATVAAGETIQFAVRAYDADMNPADPVPIEAWDVIGGIGGISSTGLFTATTVGTGSIACRGSGLRDTTGIIGVAPGPLSLLDVQPDSAEIGVGGTRTFTAMGVDAYGNTTEVGDLTWDVIGDIGEINASGVFTALAAGSGRICATSSIGGVTDTNRVVTVNPSNLDLLVIDPDTASVGISRQVKFSAYGYDASLDPVEVGPLAWEVVGGIGTIDDEGYFTATTQGTGRIAATGSNGTTDTTDMIVVDLPTIDEISIGHRNVHAGEKDVPILAFRISNAFDGRETLESIVVRDASRGAGSPQEVASNFDTLTLYMDADESLSLSPADMPLSRAPLTTDTVALSFPPVTIGPGAERTFIVSAGISRFPRDGDSLDLFLLPATDIEMAGGTMVAGADTVNSLGYLTVDGLVAAQVGLVPTGLSAITPQDGVSHVLTVDIPRNGYSDDVLEILSVFNAGSADAADIDSLLLYRDGGDGVWTAPHDESCLGRLSFTGDQWQLSGLSAGLTSQVTRFYVGARISPQAADGRTLAFGMPLHGLEMASDNDGPIDAAVIPVETIAVATPEVVSVAVVGVASGQVIPGQSTGPLLGIEFSNGYDVPVALGTLMLESDFADPSGASPDVLDEQVDAVGLWLNLDGDYANHGPADSLVATSLLAEGTASFVTTGLVLPPGGGTVGLFIECDLSLTLSKDGNTVAFMLPAADNISFEPEVSISGDFPLTADHHSVIDAFPAAAATVYPVEGTTLFGKQTDCLFLDFVLPRNGYADDGITSLRILNTGTTADKGALAALRLWADAGEAGFSGDDTLLGEFGHRGDGVWEIEGLAVSVSEGGRRFMVTADVAAYGFEGGTARFEIPVNGAGYASGMDGPDDGSLGNEDAHFLFPANRITVIPIPREYATVAPGASRAQVLTFALYNGYPEQTHVLRDLRLANRTRTRSSAGFADFELGQVSLYYDRNASRAMDDDSLLATGYFDSGTLNLSGLDVSLAAESLAYFFVTASLPVDVIDSDTLAVTIEEPSDFSFTETVNINGDFPVSRGEALEIDGSVRLQYELLGVESRTLTPGDESVPVLAFRPAVNGDCPDVLDSLTITNLGDADATDISGLRLYLDTDVDGRAQAGDVFLGDAIHMEGDWLFAGLALDIGPGSVALLVVADISEGAGSNRTIRAAIPAGGCRYVSSNDGPRDEPVVCSQTLAISGSVLKVTYDNLNPRYSVDQGISLKVRVTNLLPVPVSGVACDITPAAGDELVEPTGASIGPSDLGPGQTVEFHADYRAAHEGEVFWRIMAFASDPEESSGVMFTEPVVIQSAPTSVSVEMVSSIPTSVTRGQTRVFPLSIRYRHSEGSPLAASVRLDSVRVRVEDESGVPQPADEVFSRLILATGYTNLAIVDAPHQSSVWLRFSEPALLAPGLEQVLSLRVDIDSSATAQSFALVLDSEADLKFFDCNTAAEVPIDPAVTFPLRTASCRISSPSQSLAVSYVPSLGETANRGQPDVDVIRLVLRHPGKANESQIQFTGLSFRFVDAERNGIVASDVFESIRLVRQQAVVGELSSTELSSGILTAMLTSPPVVSPGETDTVKIQVSVRPDAPEPGFGMEIQDSTWFVLRDLSSGALVAAVSDEEAPVIGSVFPMWSGSATLMMPAGDPLICPESRLPASLIAGSDGVGLIDLAVRHAGGEDQSSVRLEKIRVAVTDSVGVPLDPRLLFDRIGVKIGGGPAGYQEFMTVESGYTVFHAGDGGIVLQPMNTVQIELVADVEAETPFDHFMLRLLPENGLVAADNTDRLRTVVPHADPACASGLPFATGAARIFLPAGSPTVRRHVMGSRIAYPGQIGLEFFQGEISYKSAGPQADLVLGGIEGRFLRRTGEGLVSFPAGAVLDAVYLILDGVTVAADTMLVDDTVGLTLDGEHIISRGAVRAMTLTCDLLPDAPRGNYLVSFDDSTFMSLLDHDLQTGISPLLVGAAYPLQTADISIVATSLSGSFVNWPNPFNPDRESTRLGFVLTQDARVDIEVFSITGELVKKVAVGASRQAGSNQEDVWDGRNDDGKVVLPGAYFLRITVDYAGGGSDEATRRVAVIR